MTHKLNMLKLMKRLRQGERKKRIYAALMYFYTDIELILYTYTHTHEKYPALGT